MDRLFNMDNKFFTVMGRVADLIMLNVVFLICCLPIVTIGASLTALHYVTLKMTRNEESYIIRSFFKSFKSEQIFGTKLRTKEEMSLMVFEYIENWYNHKRRFSALGNLTIDEFWQQYWIKKELFKNVS